MNHDFGWRNAHIILTLNLFVINKHPRSIIFKRIQFFRLLIGLIRVGSIKRMVIIGGVILLVNIIDVINNNNHILALLITLNVTITLLITLNITITPLNKNNIIITLPIIHTRILPKCFGKILGK